MKKEVIRIIAIHQENGVLVKKLEFTNEDEEFLEDEEGWDSFEEYAEYHVSDEIDSLEQLGYIAISASDRYN